MKRNIYFLLSVIFFFVSCNEDEFNVQYPKDAIPPKQVSNVQVNNLQGAVEITYDLPDELDLMYIKATYPLVTGETGEVKASAFKNSILIKGFGKSAKHKVKLVSVDKSHNESDPVIVEIEPLDAPIYDIFNSMKVMNAFGGFTINWDNPLLETVIVEIYEVDTINNLQNFIDVMHSSRVDGDFSVRGLDTLNVKLNVLMKDAYNNFSDTLEVDVKPMFEQRIPTNKLKAIPIPPYFELFGAGRDHSLMFIENASNSTYIRAGNPNNYMPWFTIDLGFEAVFSRFVHFHRNNYEWTLHNMRDFEIWGTNSVMRATEHTELPEVWREYPEWELLGDFKSVKPSGNEDGVAPTPEDMEFILRGEEFEFPIGIPPVRYVRFNIIRTWSNSTGFQSPSAILYGQAYN